MKKDSLQQVAYKRGFWASISDFFYDLKVTLFPKRRQRSARSYKAEAMVFVVALLAIPIIHWIIFWLYVNLQSISMAFTPPKGILPNVLAKMSWWEKVTYNYKSIYLNEIQPMINGTKPSTLLTGFRNTFIYFGLHIFVTMPISLFIAFFIYKKILGYKIFRIIFYLPAVIPAIVLTSAFKGIVNANGPLVGLLDIKGVDMEYIRTVGLLGTNETALITAISYTLLTAYTKNVLLFSSGMARIPTEVLEAAKLDGVGPGREIVSIVIPLIWPTFTTQFILAFTDMFSATGPIMLLTQGANDTYTFAFWMTSRIVGTQGTQISDPNSEAVRHVSAMGIVTTIIALPIVYFARWLCGKVDTVEY